MKLDYQWEGPDDFRCWGPYISFGNDASREVRITWQSKFMTMNKWLSYGETEECEIKIEEDTSPCYLHTFNLTGLKPETRYYFRISRPENHIKNKVDIYNAGILIPEFIESEGKPLYSFKTGPLQEGANFEFCITSDIHCEGTNIQNSLKMMNAQSKDLKFITVTGDINSHGGKEAAWNSYFYQLHPYMNHTIQSKETAIPALMNIPGNHDSDHPETYAHFIQTFNYPYEDVKKGGYYYFIYGNAVFIMLDSCNAGQTQAPQGLVSDDQMEWLEETLEKFAKQDYWIFVCLHHEIYSTGYKNGMISLYEMIYLDLFNEYHVDAVFYGHDHQFEAYWQSKETEWGGSHYLLIGNGGTGGTNLEEMKDREPEANYIWNEKTYVFERDGILKGNPNGARNDEVLKNAFQYGLIEETGFLYVKINGDECELKMIGSKDGSIFYHDKFKRTGKGKKFHKPLSIIKDVK
jgi:3',5'-cyclic AMP phosphodiesterase CpdA